MVFYRLLRPELLRLFGAVHHVPLLSDALLTKDASAIAAIQAATQYLDEQVQPRPPPFTLALLIPPPTGRQVQVLAQEIEQGIHTTHLHRGREHVKALFHSKGVNMRFAPQVRPRQITVSLTLLSSIYLSIYLSISQPSIYLSI